MIILPLGAIEEHGPHLPLLVDWLGAEELARVIAPYLRRAGWRPVLAPSLPYGVSFADQEDVQDGQVVSGSFQKRLAMLVHDVRVYGELLARQRRADLAGNDPGFLARYRK